MTDNKAKLIPQFMAALGAALGAFAAGATLGWSAPVEEKILSTDHKFKVTEGDFYWISAIVTLGAASSCLPSGYISKAVGLRTTMLVLVVPFLVGWLMLIFSVNPAMMIAARFILGLTGGSFCITAPIYTTEIAQDHLRGILGSFFQQFLVMGVTYAYAIGPFVDLMCFNIFCAVLPVAFFAVFFFMPESPTYWVRKGDTDKAIKSLKRLRGEDYDIVSEANNIAFAHAKSKENKISMCQALGRPVTLKALGISTGLMIIQQLGGINTILFYWTGIMMEAGSSIDPDLSTLSVGILMVLSTLVAIFVIDKIGRRPILLISGAFQAVSTFTIGAYFFFKNQSKDSVESIHWMPAVSVCVFIIMFSIGYGPVPWLMNAELFTNDIKPIAAAIAGTINWLFAFLATSTFLYIRDCIGAGPTFWTYTLVSIVGFVFVFFFVPETKGRSSDQIQELLAMRTQKSKPEA